MGPEAWSSLASQGGFAAFAAFLVYLNHKSGEARAAEVKAGHEREMALVQRTLDIVAKTNDILINQGIAQLKDLNGTLTNLCDEVAGLREQNGGRKP